MQIQAKRQIESISGNGNVTHVHLLQGMDVLSVGQFDKEKISYVFERARGMRNMVQTVGSADLLKGRVLACLFYEPSTRTSSSFIAAMQRLGGSVIPITSGVQFSSVSKGESLRDTIRTLEQYADVIVLRHPVIGSATEAADAANVPVLNAGDGAGEHPTQALLDLFTIQEELGRLDGLTITMVGDLRFGRTVHSLTKLLTLYNVKINLISPEILSMPRNYIEYAREHGLTIWEGEDVADVIAETDVLYVTRVQRERFSDLGEYDQVKDLYKITPDLLKDAKEEMVVMHPLPRVGEISEDLDSDPRAAYFRQVRNGMYIRMALLASVLGRA